MKFTKKKIAEKSFDPALNHKGLIVSVLTTRKRKKDKRAECNDSDGHKLPDKSLNELVFVGRKEWLHDSRRTIFWNDREQISRFIRGLSWQSDT